MRPIASPSSSMPLMVMAVVALFTLQQMRLFVSGLAFALDYSQGLGHIVAGLIGLVVVSLTLLTVLIVSDLNRTLVLTLVVAVGVARLVTQVAGEPLVLLGAAGLGIVLGAIAFCGLAVVLGGREAGAGLVLGGVADVSVMAMRHTLDLPHSSSGSSLLTVLVLALAAIGGVMAERQVAGPSRHGPVPPAALFAIGPWMALHLSFTGNLGYAGSITEMSFTANVALLVGGLAFALAWVAPGQVAPHPALTAIVAGGAVTALARATTGVAAFLLIVASAAAAASLAAAFDRETAAPRHRSAWAVGAGMVAGYGAVLVLYLPLTGRSADPTLLHLLMVIPLVGAGLGCLPTRSLPVSTWRVPVAVAMVLGLGAIISTTVDARPAPERLAGDPFVMTYNLHHGFGVDGALALESMARIIESTAPDIVALQEVPRGLVATGGVDVVVWLEHRLGTDIVFAAGASRQWGVALASNLATENPVTIPLGDNAEGRVALDVPINTSDGSLRVIVTHLDEVGTTSEAVRLSQIDDLLLAWGASPRAVIAGDLGGPLSDPGIIRLIEAGLVESGRLSDTPVLTYPSSDPDRQHDYIFVSRDIGVTAFNVLEHVASDHLALQVRVGTGAGIAE